MASERAVFLDRDGVLNELVYSRVNGRIRSPLSAKELRVVPSAPKAVKHLKDMGFKIFLISNQPGVAKKQLSYAEFEKMNRNLKLAFRKEGSFFDGEYFCLHHPFARIKKYKKNCGCRKPKPGLLLRAAFEKGIDLEESYFVGDGLVDVKAGKAAGCRTILISHMTGFLNKVMEKENAFPDYMVESLSEVPALIKGLKR